MTSTEAITAYIDRLRHRAAQMADRCAELRDEAADTQGRAAALDDMADALEVIRDRTPATVTAMVDFFTNEHVSATEGDAE